MPAEATMASKKAKKKAAPKALAKKPLPKRVAAKVKVAVKAAKAKKPAPKRTAAARRRPAAPKKSNVHQVVHWEIQSDNPVALHRFYAEALGWAIDANNPMGYGMVSSKGAEGINGGIGGKGPGSNDGTGSRVLVYAEVKNIPLVLERIESLGGKTLMPRTEMGPVILALYADPEGNTMGLLEG